MPGAHSDCGVARKELPCTVFPKSSVVQKVLCSSDLTEQVTWKMKLSAMFIWRYLGWEHWRGDKIPPEQARHVSGVFGEARICRLNY